LERAMTAPVQVFQVGVETTHVHKGAIGGESFIEPVQLIVSPIMTG
jgi:hypothetical protein